MVIDRALVTFLKAEKFDFKDESTGKQVVAYTGKILQGGDVFKVKISSEIYEQLKEVVEEKLTLDLKLEPTKVGNKEVCQLKVVAVIR